MSDAISVVLGYAIKRGMDNLIARGMHSANATRWNSAVREWAAQDAGGKLDPAVLLQVPLERGIDPEGFVRQDDSLDPAGLTQHFLARWRALREATDVGNLTDFFKLEEAEAASALRMLSNRLVELDRTTNGGLVSALKEAAECDKENEQLRGRFVDFADYAADKRILFTELALECEAPLGALYLSASALRERVVEELLPGLRAIRYHRNAAIVARSLGAACVAFARVCESVDRACRCGLLISGPRIDDLPEEQVDEVQAGLLAFRKSFCETLVCVLSELRADIPAAVAAGLSASQWPLSAKTLSIGQLTIDGVLYRTDGLCINRDDKSGTPYVRIGVLASDAIVHDVYLPEASEVILRAPSENCGGEWGHFFSVTPGRDWHIDGQLVRRGETRAF